MGRGKNIRSRKKIKEALKTIHSPFTSKDMAFMVGEKVARVAALLKEVDGLERIQVHRTTGQRIIYKIVGEEVK